MKKNQKSIGGILYFEWLILIIDYFKSIELKERVFDVFVPLGIGIIISTTCMFCGKVEFATKGLADVLISLISILIGFSVMLVTLLLTSSGNGVDELKKRKSDIKIHNKEISLFQKLHLWRIRLGTISFKLFVWWFRICRCSLQWYHLGGC